MRPEAGGREEGIELFRLMSTTRLLEERLEGLHRQGRVAGGLYRSLGQEAGAVGAVTALDRRTDGTGDVAAPSYRGCGVHLAMGATPRELLRQYAGRASSPSRGRDSGAGWTDLGRGILGSVTPLGITVEVMAGVALTFALRDEPRVAMVFTGDGAVSTGAWHEGLAVAAARRAPLVVVVERNQWSFSTRSEAGPDAFLRRGPGYGIEAVSEDGTDVVAVRAAAGEAVSRARSGRGVQLLELRTYRRSPHAPHDPQAYVDPTELAAWEAHDPLDRLHARLASGPWTDPFELDGIRAEIESRLDDDVAAVLDEEAPEPSSAALDVLGAPPPAWPWTRSAIPDPRAHPTPP